MSRKMTNEEYIKSLDRELVNTLGKIILEEKKTERLIRKIATETFIEELCQIIDNHSEHWKGEKNDI